MLAGLNVDFLVEIIDCNMVRVSVVENKGGGSLDRSQIMLEFRPPKVGLLLETALESGHHQGGQRHVVRSKPQTGVGPIRIIDEHPSPPSQAAHLHEKGEKR